MAPVDPTPPSDLLSRRAAGATYAAKFEDFDTDIGVFRSSRVPLGARDASAVFVRIAHLCEAGHLVAPYGATSPVPAPLEHHGHALSSRRAFGATLVWTLARVRIARHVRRPRTHHALAAHRRYLHAHAAPSAAR